MNISNLQLERHNGHILVSQNTKPRVDYVDLMKGLTILWIIWIHSDHPDFGNYRNPIFFFVSGIFFKLSDAKTFFTKRVWMIIIPFLFFFIISVPIRYFVDVWDYKSWDVLSLNRILDLFKIESGFQYLAVNVPLWFLLTLFWLQTFSFLIFRFPKWVISILACCSIFFMNDLAWNFPTPFMINNALAWFGFFALGFLIGKPIIGFLNSLKRKFYVFIVTSLIVVGCIIFERLEVTDWHGLVGNMKLIVFIISFMTFFSFFNGWSKLRVLRYFGKNSLIVLGAHFWIVVFVTRMVGKLAGTHNPIVGLISTIITALILIPIINWMNKYIPYLVGKKDFKNDRLSLKLSNIL